MLSMVSPPRCGYKSYCGSNHGRGAVIQRQDIFEGTAVEPSDCQKQQQSGPGGGENESGEKLGKVGKDSLEQQPHL